MPQALLAGAAWRMLYAMGRLHAMRLAPRARLPRFCSVYAPLQTQTVERVWFNLVFSEFTHGLDLQAPTCCLGTSTA